MSRFNNDLFNEEDTSEDEASWMDSYSDLVTDLLAVFVILFSFAMMTQVAVTNAANAKIIDVMPNSSSSDSMLPFDGGATATEAEFNRLYESIQDYIVEEGLESSISVQKYGSVEILMRVNDSVFFDTGKADFHDNSQEVLNNIAELFIEYQEAVNMIRIEGHTDNIPMRSAQFASNWELSTGRAISVLKEMLEKTGIEPVKFSAVGYSEYHPIATNETNEGRAKNRRVDFYIESVGAEETEGTPE